MGYRRREGRKGGRVEKVGKGGKGGGHLIEMVQFGAKGLSFQS